jgi:RNA polymerase sigma-70 factor (ECF subfamily)
MQLAATPDMISVATHERALSELDDIDSLVRTYRARLLRFVVSSTGDMDIAESVVQDCFLKAYNARASFRGECSVQTWLTGIALNLIRDRQRTKRFQFWRKSAQTAVDVTEMSSILPDRQSSAETRMIAREQAAAIAELLETLSFNQRTIFLMRFQEEMELSEIAETMGMSLATAKTHLHRAVRAVRDKVGGRR